jgi:hypothetical protein
MRIYLQLKSGKGNDVHCLRTMLADHQEAYSGHQTSRAAVSFVVIPGNAISGV